MQPIRVLFSERYLGHSVSFLSKWNLRKELSLICTLKGRGREKEGTIRWFGFSSNEPSMEGVVELRGPLPIPDTPDSLQIHHNAVNICNKQIYHKEKNSRMASETRHQHPRSDNNGEIAAL